MFAPLGHAYSRALDKHIQLSQGLYSLKKGDFYPLFKYAWESSFTVTNVKSSFAATGVHPMDAERVLKKFRKTTPDPPKHPAAIEEVNRRTINQLVDAEIDPRRRGADVIKNTLLSLQTRCDLLEHENDGLRYSLDLKQRDWDIPMKGKAAAKALKDQMAHEAREQKKKDKEAKDAEKAKKAKDAKAEKERCNSEKAIQLSQKGKRKASQAAPCPNKRQKKRGSATAAAAIEEALSAAPVCNTRSGRAINVPGRFR
ncbi:hypothetical protein EJ02DRAFT_359595 [Clathrospora elynae]|uniref:Uncharacterized protein n=1 Tax=Clathrospora elynae TaxID=706981 RepID=A0A6A5S9T8_9PLEO|nr:hypothetical protein EJ02DRAFT_359595 [Clathrospora elynae]